MTDEQIKEFLKWHYAGKSFLWISKKMGVDKMILWNWWANEYPQSKYAKGGER